ncbi:MAG: OmpA family protein [Spirosoma sp.]|nr:OmpA family protein [Spirosoma sp.]
MKWIRYSVVAGSIFLATLAAPGSLAQATQPKTTPDGTASMEGSVQDAATRKAIAGAAVSVRSVSGTLRAQEVITAINGLFRVILDPKQLYLIIVTADGYEPYEKSFGFTSAKVNSIKMLPFPLYRTGTQPATSPPEVTAMAPASSSSGARLTPPKTLDAKVMYTPPPLIAAVGKITKLAAIQFVQSKVELLPDAQPAMAQLLTFMQTHPTTEILLAGHTDNQGDFDANLKLSQDRVDVVKQYLVSNGIAASRITAKGYGPTRPVASNNRENSRQQNRRVEMTVVKE